MLLVTAGVGIWAAFSDGIGELQGKILVTTGTISGACIVALPCLAHTEREYLRYAAWPAVGVVTGTALLTIALVWVEHTSRTVEQVMISGWIAAAAAFAAFITLLARPVRGWTWVQPVTIALTAILAAELIYAVWVTVDWGEEFLTATAILMTLGIVSTWVLHVVRWLSNRGPDAGRVMCPRCGKTLAEQPGDMLCGHCHTVFSIKS
jgi:hypothetical protein